MGLEQFAGTMPVTDAQRFDQRSLEQYLVRALPGFAG